MEEIILYRRKTRKALPSLSTSNNPIKRHFCRENSSMAWFNDGKTRPVEEYKYIVFDEYSRKADSSQDFHTMEELKHGQQEIAITRHGKMEELTASSAKRIWCLYSPKSENSSKNSVLYPESLELPPFTSTEDNSSLKPSLAAERTSSKSTECDSSASNLEGTNSDQVSKPLGDVERKNLKLKGEIKIHNDQENFNVDIKDQNTDGMNKKIKPHLDLEFEKLDQSAYAGNRFKVTSSHLDPSSIDQQALMEAALVDIDLTVQASYRVKNGPFVCLKSESYGAAILGYPLEIGEITDGSEGFLPSEESVARNLFGDKGSRFHQLVWRTSKRTPVCYVTNSLSSCISKNVKPGQDCQNAEDSIPSASQNDLLAQEKSLTVLLKNPKQLNQGQRALGQACVPVELVFSKILEAVCQVQS